MKKLYSTFAMILSCITANAQWASVGTGVSSSSDVLNIYNEQLISAGRYSSLSKWDGSAWSDFSPTGSPSATAILVDGSNLYSGGQFTGGEAMKQISHYNGSTWSFVGSGISSYSLVLWNTNSRWWSIFKFNNALIGVYDGGVLKFDSSTDAFVYVGDPEADLGAPVYGLRYAGTMNNVAYFGGMSGGIQKVFTWNNIQWDTLNLADYPYRAIMGTKVVNNQVFIGGIFQHTGGTLSSLLKWDGNALTSVMAYGSGIPTIQEMYATPTHLYARTFLNVTGLSVWNGAGFTSLSGEMFQQVGSLNALAELNGTLYAGGFFTLFDNVPANNIVQRSAFTGISDAGLVQPLSVYPNPVIDNVCFEPATANRIVHIYSISGQLCLTTVIAPGETQLSLTHFPAGVYTIKIIHEHDISVSRIVKQ